MPTTAVNSEPLLRRAARTAALATLAERVIAEALRAETERVALAARVRELEARLGALEPGPLLPGDAFLRIQRAQQERADLREDLRRRREQYADCLDAEEPVAGVPGVLG